MFISSPLLTSLPYIRHGFFTRQGGVSKGIYASLNCGPGSGDDPAHVQKNRDRVTKALSASPENLCTLYQVHGSEAVTVTAPWEYKDAPKADAMVTTTSGVTLGILTADCVPILLADSKSPVIAAAHAGWKGAVSGVAEAAIEAMLKLGAKRENLIAAVGPAIGKSSYEVGPEFYARFLEENKNNADFFAPSPTPAHYHFDIKAYVKERLARAGVLRVEILPHDTCEEEAQFFSYRRSTLRKEKDYGRQISAIKIV